jgi:D-alanine-D-alanine ligase
LKKNFKKLKRFNMAKKKIGVIFGGRSVEHEISVLSAIQCMDALDVEKYEIHPIYIAHDGKWYTGKNLREKAFYKRLPQSYSEVTYVTFSADPAIGGLVKKESGFFGSKDVVIPIDIYLPVFHGQYGEDGCIQGLFEVANVIYAGPQVLASSVAMNKYVCKTILKSHGIPVLPSLTVSKHDAQENMDLLCKKVTSSEGLGKFPLFVKPGNLGSSVGVSRAKDDAELAVSLAKVFKLDNEAIVEPCITNLMEINVSVIEADPKLKKVIPEVSVVEIPVSSGEFLSYDDKYLREGKGKKGGASRASEGMASLTRVIDPDNLDPKYKNGVRDFAAKAYQILSCSGVVRFDFMVDLDQNELYFNELNTIPGSLAFYLWERSNPALLMSDILDRIIEGAESRFALKNQLQRDIGFKALS